MICKNTKKQGFYKKKFLEKHPEYTSEHFKNFVNMYFAVINVKKLKYIGTSKEIMLLLDYWKENDKLEQPFLLIKLLDNYNHVQGQKVPKKVKIKCNQIFDYYKKEKLFDI